MARQVQLDPMPLGNRQQHLREFCAIRTPVVIGVIDPVDRGGLPRDMGQDHLPRLLRGGQVLIEPSRLRTVGAHLVLAQEGLKQHREVHIACVEGIIRLGHRVFGPMLPTGSVIGG